MAMEGGRRSAVNSLGMTILPPAIHTALPEGWSPDIRPRVAAGRESQGHGITF